MRSFGLFVALLLGTTGAGRATVPPIDEAAKLFGARQQNYGADLSPLADKIVFLSATDGAATAIRILDVPTDKVTQIGSVNGKPERLRWCSFASETKIVCQFAGNVQDANLILGFSRLVVIDLDKKKSEPLGVQQKDRDAGLRQDDGASSTGSPTAHNPP